MPAMDPDDYRLSMRLSPRSSRKPEPKRLRSLRIDRFSDTVKAVLRRPIRSNRLSVHCEPCNQWFVVGEQAPQEFTCPRCDSTYRIELVVYEEVVKGQGSPDARVDVVHRHRDAGDEEQERQSDREPAAHVQLDSSRDAPAGLVSD